MIYGHRQITKDIYDRAMEHNGFFTSEDKQKVFDVSELCEYGVYGAKAYEENGEYFVGYSMGSSCD